MQFPIDPEYRSFIQDRRGIVQKVVFAEFSESKNRGYSMARKRREKFLQSTSLDPDIARSRCVICQTPKDSLWTTENADTGRFTRADLIGNQRKRFNRASCQ